MPDQALLTVDTSTISLHGGRLAADLVKDINRRLAAELAEAEYGFTPPDGYYAPSQLTIPPDIWYVACYAVPGGSEGHFVHIDLIPKAHGQRQALTFAKVWGWDTALKLSNAATRLLWDHGDW